MSGEIRSGPGGYANAADVLPPRLLRRIQAYWWGLLWIPSPAGGKRQDQKLRDARIRRLHAQGLTPADLAREFHLTAERIRQIVRRGKTGLK